MENVHRIGRIGPSAGVDQVGAVPGLGELDAFKGSFLREILLNPQIQTISVSMTAPSDIPAAWTVILMACARS